MASWIRRLGSKRSGFRYVDADERPVRDQRTLVRIDALRVPPAWTDVHVAASPRTAVQAWGFDARGRKQYRYNDRAVELRELRKYYRVRQLAKELPRLRERLREDSAARTLRFETVAATLVRLIGESFCRVGSDRYTKENGTYGITTLTKRHVRVDGSCIRFAYVGKGSKRQRQTIVNPQLARVVAKLLDAPGTRVFRYVDADGEWHDMNARDVNDYVHHRLGAHYTAKDFRTWGGTLRAATVLAEIGPARTETEAKRNVALAMRLVAAELGNTPTICRKSYVHPMVIARYLDEGETIALPANRRAAPDRGHAHSPEERSLISFLDRHFPERRRKPRIESEAVAA